MTLTVYGAVGTGTSFGTTGTASITPQNVGDTIIVFASGNGTISGITDTALNSWSRRSGLTPPNYSSGMDVCDEWYAVANGTASTTLAITFTAGCNACVFGISGAASSGQFDSNASLPATYAAGPTTNQPSGAATTAANTILFAVSSTAAAATPTLGGGWIPLITNTNYFGAFAYQIVNSIQSAAFLQTPNVSAGILDAIDAFIWSPLSLTNIVGFWRADKGVTQSGGAVTAWADQTANGNNLLLSNISSATSPTYSATGFNGVAPGISFAGSSANGLASGSNSSMASATLGSEFLVLIVNSRVPVSLIAGWLQNSGAYYSNPSFVFYDNSFSAGPGLGSFPMYDGQGGAVLAFNTGTIVVATLTFDGTNSNGYINNTEQTPVSPINTIGGTGAFFVGSPNNNGSISANFTIAALGFCSDYTMNTTDIANLVTWANNTFINQSQLLSQQQLIFM